MLVLHLVEISDESVSSLSLMRPSSLQSAAMAIRTRLVFKSCDIHGIKYVVVIQYT